MAGAAGIDTAEIIDTVRHAPADWRVTAANLDVTASRAEIDSQLAHMAAAFGRTEFANSPQRPCTGSSV